MPTVQISAYVGSVVGTDWGPAIEAALDAIKATGGTVNIDQDIQIETSAIVGDVTNWKPYVPLNFTSDGGTMITLAGAAATAFSGNGNLITQSFTGLNLIGNTVISPGAGYININVGMFSMPLGSFLIEKCMFAGIAATTALIHSYSNPGPLTIRDSSFSGCGATTHAVVYAEESETVSLENVQFYDYQSFRDVLYNKQSYAPYWLKAVYTATPVTSHVPMVSLKNVRTDEGANFCYIEGYPRVDIIQCAANVNSVAGQGIYLKNVDEAVITQFWAGDVNGPLNARAAIKLETCGHVLIDGLQTYNGQHRIEADAFTNVTIRNSPDAILVRV